MTTSARGPLQGPALVRVARHCVEVEVQLSADAEIHVHCVVHCGLYSEFHELALGKRHTRPNGGQATSRIRDLELVVAQLDEGTTMTRLIAEQHPRRCVHRDEWVWLRHLILA